MSLTAHRKPAAENLILIMKKIISIIVATVSAVLLSGCFLPEKFSATVKVNDDGSYSYKYSGTAAFFPALLSSNKKKGGLSPQEEKSFDEQVLRYAATHKFKKTKALGNGHYEIEIDDSRSAGQSAGILDTVNIVSSGETLSISAIAVSERDKSELAKLDFKINGRLEVTIPDKAEILKTNGTPVSKFFGSGKTYRWDIGSIENRPYLQIKFRG